MRISDWSSDVCSSDLVQRIYAGLCGRLRIGFVGSMLYRGLPGLLAAMRAALPDVEHVLTELNSHDQIEAVRRGEQDLGFIHANPAPRSEEHTSELQSLMRISYAVFCLKKQKAKQHNTLI